MIRDLNSNTAVLRGSLIGNIHPGHNLYPAENGLLEVLRNRHSPSKQPVNTKADEQVLAAGFKVNIAGILLECL